ncbi:MAG: alpha/beta hydrolase [Bdellovibrionales bacterium]
MPILIAMATWFLCGCSSFLYQPTRQRYVDPAKLEHPPHEIHFHDVNGTDLVAWHFKPKSPAKARLVFFHGNAQNISSHFVSLYWLVDQGYEFLIFDYPGYGISTGAPTPKNTIEAGVAALQWLYGQQPARPLAVFGQSLGGAVALRAAVQVKGQIPLCLVTVDSTFTSYKKAARDLLATHWATWLFQPLAGLTLSDRFAPDKHIGKLAPIPLTVIHGEKDSIVHPRHGREVFEQAGQPKEFWLVPQGQHIGVFNGANREIFRARFLKSLNQHCSAKVTP